MDDLLDHCGDLPVEDFAAGTVLIEEGAVPGRMLVLVEGAVIIERDGVPVARTDNRGAVFGEMSAVLGSTATATVRAQTPVRVRVVGDPQSFLRERPGAALAVLRTTASRLDGMTRYVADLKGQLAGSAGHLAMVGDVLDTLVNHQGVRPQPGSRRDPQP